MTYRPAGLLWAIIYRTLQNLRAKVPALQVVRHEDWRWTR